MAVKTTDAACKAEPQPSKRDDDPSRNAGFAVRCWKQTQVHAQALGSLVGQASETLWPSWASVVDDGLSALPTNPWCPRCGLDVGANEATESGCHACRGKRLAWHQLVRLAPYAFPVTEWIKAAKYDGQWPLAEAMGQALGQLVVDSWPRFAAPKASWAESGVVVHVPMHARRKRQRGYDQAELLAHALAKTLGCPAAGLLRRTRATPKQSTVALNQRTANVKNAFACAAVDLSNTDVLLVDDVKTTGATLKACIQALKRHKPRSVSVAVVAVAQ